MPSYKISNVTEPWETDNRTPSYFLFPISLHPQLISSIYTFRVSVDLKAFLRHFSIPQKFQGHPNKMPFNLIELLPDLLRRHIRVVQVALFVFAMFGEEMLVVIEGFNYEMCYR